MNSMIINEHALHFEVGLLAIFLVLVLDKGILKALAGALISDNLTGQDLSKSAENEVQIFIYEFSILFYFEYCQVRLTNLLSRD